MTYLTYAEALAIIENDLDLQQETFVTPDEMKGYFNAAIDEAEAEIHGIYEDYFLNKGTVNLVAGQSDIVLPSDMYALKIRAVIYDDGTNIYPIERMPEKDKFQEIAWNNKYSNTNPTYRYIIYNPAGTANPKLHLVPKAAESKTGAITIWYLRNANRITGSADKIDIPEFIQFVLQFVKVRCYEKEGHPNLQFAIGALEQQRKLMVDTLTRMVPDNNNEIEKDLSHYEETV